MEGVGGIWAVAVDPSEMRFAVTCVNFTGYSRIQRGEEKVEMELWKAQNRVPWSGCAVVH